MRLLCGRDCRSGLGGVPRRAVLQPVFHFGADEPFQCKPAPDSLGVPHTGFVANAVQPPHSGWGAVWIDGLHQALRRGCGHGEGTMERSTEDAVQYNTSRGLTYWVRGRPGTSCSPTAPACKPWTLGQACQWPPSARTGAPASKPVRVERPKRSLSFSMPRYSVRGPHQYAPVGE